MTKISNYSSPFQSLYNKLSSYSLIFPLNSRWTKQSFKDECDINTLMARYQSTGELPVINERAPQYLDVTTGFDFHLMQNQLVEAQNLFNDLPSKLRNRFANDPGQFLEFCSNPENRAEMSALGLLKPTASPLPGANASAPIPNPQPSSPDPS